jgi:KDO2-lipid IV(A) lauroyltransferase
MTFKKIAGKSSFHLVKFLLFLSRILPLKASYAICHFFASAGTLLKWDRKQIALANLAIVFPKMTDEEKQAIFRESLVKILKNYFEICFFTSGKWSADDVAEAVTASGLEYLDDLIESGKGALLYSGHIGNFPLMMVWLAMKGYPVAAVYKEAKNFPDDFFGSIMSRFNVTPLKYKSDPSLTTAIIRLLKEKKIVLLLNDQSHPTGVYINFFNKSVPSLAGPALLSKRLGVPVIPAYIIRDNSNHHHITILPEMPLAEVSDNKNFIVANTQLQIDWIAGIVETHPTEWLWLHNRWKRAR